MIYQIEGNTARERFDGLSIGMEHLKETIWWNEARRCKENVECI